MKRSLFTVLATFAVIFASGCSKPEEPPAANVVQPGDPGYLKGDAGTNPEVGKPAETVSSE